MTVKMLKENQRFWTIILLIIGFIWMCPLIFMVSMSFRKPEKAFEPVLIIFPFVLQNFKLVLSQNKLLPNFISSTIITSSSVFLVTLTAAMAAFGLTRKQIIGKTFVMIWQFLTSWNEFFLALVTMSETGKKTLTLIPMQYQGFYFSQPGALFAILVIICTPMILFYILVQKYFVRGMLTGAIKG